MPASLWRAVRGGRKARRPLDRYANRAPSATLIGVGAADSVNSKESTMAISARAAAPSVDPVLVEALGPEAESLPPALAARVREALIHAPAPSANAPESAFFDALARCRAPASSMGGIWRARRVNAGIEYALAAVDQALAGVSGVAEILAAAESARLEDGIEQHLSPNLVDRLHNALGSLSRHARDELERARVALADGGAA